jgi:murein L,D-transpeptidase YcbB/YkuD
MRTTFKAYTPAAALGNYYGPNLCGAIKEFQRRTGLVAAGNTGPITYKKLQSFGFKG